MANIEFVKESNYIEETDYEEDYKLTVKGPKWHGYEVWYLVPNPINDFVIKEPCFILFDGDMFRLATSPEETKELNKFYKFYT